MMHSFGVIGTTLANTLSPRLFALIAEETGEKIAYGVFQLPPERLDGVVGAARVLGVHGLNVTMPYKVDILPYIDEIVPEARSIGSINTVKFHEDGGTTAYNTDYYGFLRMVREAGIEIKGKRFLLCGKSGAARAVYKSLEDAGAREIAYASTDPAKGIPYDKLPGALRGEWNTIVNCTPVGMAPKADASVVDKVVLGRFDSAVDIVYTPAETKFLRLAGELGLPRVGGLPMLAYQGIQSFTFWTGIEVDAAAGRRICAELGKSLL